MLPVAAAFLEALWIPELVSPTVFESPSWMDGRADVNKCTKDMSVINSYFFYKPNPGPVGSHPKSAGPAKHASLLLAAIIVAGMIKLRRSGLVLFNQLGLLSRLRTNLH